MKPLAVIRWLFPVACLAFAFLVFLLPHLVFGVQVLDLRLQDRLMPAYPPSKDIVIVAIDDKSIQEFGVWPWPRSLHARMVHTLVGAGATVIGYDVTFSEASTKSEDDVFKKALSNNPLTVLASERTTTWNQDMISTLELEPIAPLKTAVNGRVGVVSLITDADGIVRRFSPYQDLFAAIVLQTGKYWANYPTEKFPVYEYQKKLLPYAAAPGSFTTYSFSDVINNDFVSTDFLNKIVLVGATAPNLHDAYLTPMSNGELMTGVEIHANLIQALLEGRELKTLNETQILLLLTVIAILMAALGSSLSLRYMAIATPGVLVIYLLSATAFSSFDTLLPVIQPVLLIIGLGVLNIVVRYLVEKKQRAFIHSAFAHYLAPAVIEKLVQGETKLELGGVKRELTILFSDIRGFTSLSEKLKPEELVPFLNEYLTAMTDVVLDSEGVVDKYIGDAIMAFWGAPILQDDHAVRAAMTAVLMKRRLARLQAAWSKSGKPHIDIGIGLNTGEVLVGNMGSKQRFDYTVIGDDVNLASRLEGLTKQYGVTALISEATRNKLGDKFVVRELDLVAVKGRTQPVKIFELIEEHDQTEQSALARIEKFEIALAHYRKQEWIAARTILQSLAATDKPSAVFLDRIAYLETHPPTDWDGSFTAKEK